MMIAYPSKADAKVRYIKASLGLRGMMNGVSRCQAAQAGFEKGRVHVVGEVRSNSRLEEMQVETACG